MQSSMARRDGGLQPAHGAALTEELDRVLDEEPALRFGPRRIERDAEPAGQPVERVGRRAANIEQRLHRCNPILDRRVEPFDVGEKPIEERGRVFVFAIHRWQVLFEVREARIVGTERANAGRGALVAVESVISNWR